MSSNYSLRDSVNTKFAFDLQCYGAAGQSIQEQKKAYLKDPRPLHRQIEKISDFIAQNPRLIVPKTFRSYCDHQLNGVCQRKANCSYAHTVALRYIANLKYTHGLYKTSPCSLKNECPRHKTDECGFTHEEEIQYRPKEVFIIPVSPPDSPRSLDESPKGSTPLAPPSLKMSERDDLSDLYISEDDGLDFTPPMTPTKLFSGKLYVGMPPLEIVESPGFQPKNTELLSLLSPLSIQPSHNPDLIPPLDLSKRLLDEVHPDLLEHTFGPSISIPSTPGSEQRSSPPLRIVSPPPEERISLVRNRKLVSAEGPLSPRSALRKIVELDTNHKPIQEQVESANQDLPKFYKKVDQIKELFSHCSHSLPAEGYKTKMCKAPPGDCLHEDRCNFAHDLATIYAQGETYVEKNNKGPFIPYQLTRKGFLQYPTRRAVE